MVCAVLAALGVVTALLRGAEGGDPSSVSDARPDDEGPAGQPFGHLSRQASSTAHRAGGAIAKIVYALNTLKMDGVPTTTNINDVAQVFRSAAGWHWQDDNQSNGPWIAVGVS